MLDFFGTVGALRPANDNRKNRLFADAYRENPLLATKCLFYARDIRGGLGERQTFRTILRYAAVHHPECVRPNIPLIPLYGRFDDLYALVGTPVEAEMWDAMRKQLVLDEKHMREGKTCSLMAKWLKTPDTSSAESRKLAAMTANGLGLTLREYKHALRTLRKYLKIVERSMSQNQWENIEYASVPSKAMTLYRKAFGKHDADRFGKYLEKVQKGETKINAATLFPYDLVSKYRKNYYNFSRIKEDPVVEAQWAALPNYVEGNSNAIVVADMSGSMSWNSNGRPLDTAIGLALYFAERNTGPYHGLWMSFSADSKVQTVKGETLAQHMASMDTQHWGQNTNLEAAFLHILNIAVANSVPQDEMVKSIIIISDMEIDEAVGRWSFYDEMAQRFRHQGYQIPNVVFWNVESRNDTFHVDHDRKGVQLCSGQATSTFKALMGAVNMTPEEMMKKTLESDRYAPVRVDPVA